MKRFLAAFVFAVFPFLSIAQKVGVVLSGGAAKGIAHIGVLKALEENEIPIDYIVGTSMGGIIGGCYAAGMSPEQIEHLVLSPEFLRWVNGSPEKGYNYFYHQPEDNPGFLKLNLALDSTFTFQLNSSLANDVSLNFALAEYTAQASAISNYNFDSLFVPLRIVAADIFTQSEVILSKGVLSDALRATLTVPVFYNPVRVDGRFLYDGGVYNNFPVDVAQENFQPDVIIGVNVSSKVFKEYPYDRDEKLISNSLLYLLLDKSDPAKIPENGVFIQPNLDGYSAFDFARAKSLIDSGYAQTLRQIEEIREKIPTRHACDSVAIRRNKFLDKSKPFQFQGLSFRGFHSKQREYIRRVFNRKKDYDKIQSLDEIKKAYFRLVSEDYFSNVYPRIQYDTSRNTFNLHLSKRPQQNFQVDLGGVVATRDISNIYLGLNYFHFNRRLTHYYLGIQTGSFYKNADVSLRLDFPKSFFVQPELSYNNWNYVENEDLLENFSFNDISTILDRVNRSYGLTIGFPFKESYKSTVSIHGFNNVDRFANGNLFKSGDILDKLQTRGYSAGVAMYANSMNRKQYPSSGSSFYLSGYYFNVHEEYQPGNTSVLYNTPVIHRHLDWFRLKGSVEHYLGRGRFHPGYLVEGVYSNQPYFVNYFSTIINMPAFYPLQDSRTLILENFRAPKYLAIGSRNVWNVIGKLDLRLEGFLFKPFERIVNSAQMPIENTENLSQAYFCAGGSLVYHTLIGPLSLSFNYYDDQENKYGILFHAGFLLFNSHSLE